MQGGDEATRRPARGSRSQTLERSIDVLHLLSDGGRRSSHAIAAELGLHRSIVYRILRTFEDAALVARDEEGRYLLGLGLLALGESSAAQLQRHVTGVLQMLADASSATAVLCTRQREEAVVLAATRPVGVPASVMILTGSRFPLRSGAPGYALASLARAEETDQDEVRLMRQTNVIRSKDEPFAGLESAATPVRVAHGQSAALALLAPTGVMDHDSARRALLEAARQLTGPSAAWEA